MKPVLVSTKGAIKCTESGLSGQRWYMASQLLAGLVGAFSSGSQASLPTRTLSSFCEAT